MTNRHYVIVVAEDDPTLNILLSDLLEEAGYKVVSCLTGVAAYQTATRLQADAVITDMHMEAADAGLQLLERLRANPSTTNVGVIVCSADGFSLQKNESRVTELGGAVVHKPFDIENFLATVRRVLKQV